MYTHDQLVSACACFIYININEQKLSYIDRLAQIAKWIDETEFEILTKMFDCERLQKWMLKKIDS
jgi:hypothetical protein